TQADAERALQAALAEAASPPVQTAEQTAQAGDLPQAPVESDRGRSVLSARPPLESHPFDSLTDETEICDKYLAIFIDETEIALDDLAETLLALEGGGSREAIEKLLLMSHRIKGSAASVGLNRAAKLAHLMEDLLQNLVETAGTLSAEVTDALLRSTDGLRQYVACLRTGERRCDQFAQLARELLAAQGRQESARAAEPPSAGIRTGENDLAPPKVPVADAVEIPAEFRRSVAARAPSGVNTYAGAVVFRPGQALVGLKARLIYEKLNNVAEICLFEPPPAELDEIETLDRVLFGVSTEKEPQWLARELRVGGVESVVFEPVRLDQQAPAVVSEQKASPGPCPAGHEAEVQDETSTDTESRQTAADQTSADGDAARRRGTDASSKPTETLRVDIERLDHLMNLAGQLVINKARFAQICEGLKTAVSSKQSSLVLADALTTLEKIAASPDEKGRVQADLENAKNQARRIQRDLEAVRRDLEVLAHVRGAVNDLGEAIHQLDRVTDGIQQSVMDTRMVPIGPLFARFKRVVRDITRANGKSIRLLIKGEKTELDKRMIDELGDPLIHMVRNSADHGIEPPAARAAAGKPGEGTITLDAFHRGNNIVIQVSDDGKGLDPDRILRKAVEKGMVSAADAEKMSRQQIYQLIWEPGLSTAEKVTEVSGRGMGMDIVKSKIEDLNGSIELDSTPGQGTTITIKLPLTLAILPSLMVEIDGDVFAMPIESVAEIVSVGARDRWTVHGRWAARVRGRVISMVELCEVFTWTRGTPRRAGERPEETTLVVVGETGREIGLVVDRVLGEEDIVIKSMAENYRNVPGIAGASILGDGRVSLILDLPSLIEMASHKPAATAAS
ncbi:MAG: chemotaxis protein CheA, partial [Pirellulales bacterium]|nr:chemotaxis protein CheA [Pirellulales bacterium]